MREGDDRIVAIGEAKTIVSLAKLELPKEYKLRKKKQKIYGAWVGENILYLSDNVNSLKATTGEKVITFETIIDNAGRINVQKRFEKSEATIRGCISTIEIKFEN